MSVGITFRSFIGNKKQQTYVPLIYIKLPLKTYVYAMKTYGNKLLLFLVLDYKSNMWGVCIYCSPYIAVTVVDKKLKKDIAVFPKLYLIQHLLKKGMFSVRQIFYTKRQNIMDFLNFNDFCINNIFSTTFIS